MRNILQTLLVCICLFPAFVNAQNIQFHGKVVDESNNQPLEGASIYIPDLKKGVVVNQEGHFTLNNIPSGRHVVEISFYGYKTQVVTIDFTATVERIFKLPVSIVEQEKVVITGMSSATSSKKAPIAIQMMNKRELLSSASTNLIDAISRVPGVQQISSGPAISKPVIRGLGFNRVVVVNDGIRQEGQQWGEEHGIEIDEYSVSKVEVLKGPASLMYGSDALAGVINIISLTPVPEGTIRANVLGSYNTNNLQRGTNFMIGGNQHGFVWGAYGSLKAAADYRNKYDGRVFNSKFNEKNIGGYLGLHKHWGFTQLNITHFNQQAGMVTGERDEYTGRLTKPEPHDDHVHYEIPDESDFNSTKPFIPYQSIKHFKIASENSFNIGSDRLAVTVGYQNNYRRELGNVIHPEETEMGFDLKTINYNFIYHLHPVNSWKTSFGLNGMWQSNTNRGEERMIPDYQLFDAGIFFITQKSFDKVTLSGGIRYDHRSIQSEAYEDHDHELQFEDFTRQFSNFSASAGISYQFHPKWNAKLNIAKGFRAPNMAELASNGAHHGTNRFEYGNRNLKSESSYQVDAGLAYEADHISIEASLFYNYVNNYVYYRRLQSVNGGDSIIVSQPHDEEEDDHGHHHDHGDLYAFEFNQDNAFLLGGEIKLDIHPHPLHWLHIENTFSYVRGVLTERRDGSRNLPFIPAARLVNEVRADLGQNKWFKSAYLKIQLDNTFRQDHAFTGYNTETVTPGYSLLNLGIGTDIHIKGKSRFSVYLAGNNLTDQAYQSHLSRLKYTDVNEVTGRTGVFNMGRNFNVKVNVPIGIR